jgi:phenylalanyl-tRNA synthetase beta chain
VRILNPLSGDLNVMRQTLLFGMLEAVELNINHKNGDMKLSEFGNCYLYDEAKHTPENALAPYTETYRLAVAVTGLAAPASWNARPQAASFFTLREVTERVLRRFGIDIYTLKSETLQSDLFGEALTMSLNGKELLQIGSVSAKIRRMMDIKQEVWFMELNFGLLAGAIKKHKITVEELSKYPEVKRDLALLIDKNITFSTLRETAFAAERKLLKSVSLFDVYEGDRLPEGKKSYALSFILEDKTRTLDDKTIERTMANLTRQFEEKCNAQVRA